MGGAPTGPLMVITPSRESEHTSDSGSTFSGRVNERENSCSTVESSVLSSCFAAMLSKFPFVFTLISSGVKAFRSTFRRNSSLPSSLLTMQSRTFFICLASEWPAAEIGSRGESLIMPCLKSWCMRQISRFTSSKMSSKKCESRMLGARILSRAILRVSVLRQSHFRSKRPVRKTSATPQTLFPCVARKQVYIYMDRVHKEGTFKRTICLRRQSVSVVYQ